MSARLLVVLSLAGCAAEAPVCPVEPLAMVRASADVASEPVGMVQLGTAVTGFRARSWEGDGWRVRVGDRLGYAHAAAFVACPVPETKAWVVATSAVRLDGPGGEDRQALERYASSTELTVAAWTPGVDRFVMVLAGGTPTGFVDATLVSARAPDAAWLVTTAREAVQAGDLAHARVLANQAHAVEPGHADARELLSAFVRAEDVERSIALHDWRPRRNDAPFGPAERVEAAGPAWVGVVDAVVQARPAYESPGFELPIGTPVTVVALRDDDWVEVEVPASSEGVTWEAGPFVEPVVEPPAAAAVPVPEPPGAEPAMEVPAGPAGAAAGPQAADPADAAAVPEPVAPVPDGAAPADPTVPPHAAAIPEPAPPTEPPADAAPTLPTRRGYLPRASVTRVAPSAPALVARAAAASPIEALTLLERATALDPGSADPWTALRDLAFAERDDHRLLAAVRGLERVAAAVGVSVGVVRLDGCRGAAKPWNAAWFAAGELPKGWEEPPYDDYAALPLEDGGPDVPDRAPLPDDTCLVATGVWDGCPPAPSGPREPDPDASEEEQARWEEERDRAEEADALATHRYDAHHAAWTEWSRTLAEEFVDPRLRVQLTNTTSARIDPVPLVVYRYTPVVDGYCDIVENARHEGVIVRRVAVPPLAPGATAEVWFELDDVSYTYGAYAPATEADAARFQADFLAPTWSGQGSGAFDGPEWAQGRMDEDGDGPDPCIVETCGC